MLRRIEKAIWPLVQRSQSIASGHWWLQSFYARLHSIARTGMHIGPGAWVASSGEGWVLAMLSSTFSGAVTIVDVGANIGDYTAATLLAFGQRATLYAFEPARTTADTLLERFKDEPRAHIFAYGLGAEDASVPLYGDSIHPGMNSAVQRKIGEKWFSVQEQITLRPLSTVCHEHGITHIHLLKIDVEGLELAVLQGARSLLQAAAIDAIQFEFGGTALDSRVYLRDFYRLLWPQYELHRIVRNGIVPLGPYNETLEVFSLTNFLAVRRGVPIRTH